MSLREARGEEKEDDDGEWSSTDAVEAADAEDTDLLECLLHYAERAPLSRSGRDPMRLCLDLSSDFCGQFRRGLLPSSRAPYLNAFVQALLPCAPLMHLFEQLSWHALQKQRLAYACLVQIASQFFSSLLGEGPTGSQVGATFPPFDACAYAEPLLRRFERAKNSASVNLSSLGPSWLGPTETLARFVHFVLGQLHDECKWATLSPSAGHYEDSPITRIFGGVLRIAREQSWPTVPDSGSLVNLDHSGIEPFLVLHVDVASDPCTSVSSALQNHLSRPERANFLRLPPCLLIHLQRFRIVDGVPTKVSRHCNVDLRLELEESANCVLRGVSYELCSAICHYGELPEGGSYKALSRHVATPFGAPAPTIPAFGGGGGCSGFAAASPAGPAGGIGGRGGGGGGGGGSEWFVFDDAAVRAKATEDLAGVLQCEGYHVCFLLYKREDTKKINMRPHAL